jgi:hypothetical protein
MYMTIDAFARKRKYLSLMVAAFGLLSGSVALAEIAGSSEPSHYTWSIDSQTRAEGGITRYSGVDTSNPVDASAGNFGRGTTATTSAVTTGSNSEEVIAL